MTSVDHKMALEDVRTFLRAEVDRVATCGDSDRMTICSRIADAIRLYQSPLVEWLIPAMQALSLHAPFRVVMGSAADVISYARGHGVSINAVQKMIEMEAAS